MGPRSCREHLFRRPDRSRGSRADGPRPRPLRASRLVVALGPVDPAKSEGVRAFAFRFHDEPSYPFTEFARIPALGSRTANRDRLPAAKPPCRAHSCWPACPVQLDRDYAGRRPDDGSQSLHLLDFTLAQCNEAALAPLCKSLSPPGSLYYGTPTAGVAL